MQILCKILLLFLLYVVALMQGIYSYVPETNHVSRVHAYHVISTLLVSVKL